MSSVSSPSLTRKVFDFFYEKGLEPVWEGENAGKTFSIFGGVLMFIPCDNIIHVGESDSYYYTLLGFICDGEIPKTISEDTTKDVFSLEQIENDVWGFLDSICYQRNTKYILDLLKRIKMYEKRFLSEHQSHPYQTPGYQGPSYSTLGNVL